MRCDVVHGDNDKGILACRSCRTLSRLQVGKLFVHSWAIWVTLRRWFWARLKDLGRPVPRGSVPWRLSSQLTEIVGSTVAISWSCRHRSPKQGRRRTKLNQNLSEFCNRSKRVFVGKGCELVKPRESESPGTMAPYPLCQWLDQSKHFFVA